MIWQFRLDGIKWSPCFKIPIPPLNPQIVNTYTEIWDQNEIMLILDVWWFNNPAQVELRDPSYVKTPSLQILNTPIESWDQNEIVLILDVWWFDNPALVELRGPSLF